MTQLKITIYGTATELLIGSFPKDGADWILEYCEEFKPYTDIEEVWYGEGLIPEEWTKQKAWDNFDNIFHNFGFNFSEKNEIKWFLSGELAPEPKIKGIYFDGVRIKSNLNHSPHIYAEIDLPYLTENEVFVYHGVVYIVSIDYILNIHRNFSSESLSFHFFNCGENRYMLTEIDYDEKPMKRYYSGSDILVNSGWYSLSPNNKAKSLYLIKSGKFLDVKFTK